MLDETRRVISCRYSGSYDRICLKKFYQRPGLWTYFFVFSSRTAIEMVRLRHLLVCNQQDAESCSAMFNRHNPLLMTQCILKG